MIIDFLDPSKAAVSSIWPGVVDGSQVKSRRHNSSG